MLARMRAKSVGDFEWIITATVAGSKSVKKASIAESLVRFNSQEGFTNGTVEGAWSTAS
jgi:ubiquinone biosynthesis protein COQ9